MVESAGVPGVLQGQVSVITGSGQGIGAGIAATLGAMGARLVIADLDGAKAKAKAAELATGGVEAVGVQHDVTDADSGFDLAQEAVTAFGRVDILVNNAGLSGRVPLLEMEPRTWDTMLNVNLTGVQRTSRAIAPLMCDQGSGSIVSISSVVGRSGKANMTHYSASKFGVIGFTQALALELAPYNVRVNAVCPGIVRTPMWDAELEEIAAARNCSIEEAWQFAVSGVPLGRPQTAEDIGNAVAFLASRLGANITGQSLVVDGGYEIG